MRGGEEFVVAFGCMCLYEVKCTWVDSSYAPVYSLKYKVKVDWIAVGVVLQRYDYLLIYHWVLALNGGWGVVSFSSMDTMVNYFSSKSWRVATFSDHERWYVQVVPSMISICGSPGTAWVGHVVISFVALG